MLPTVQMRCSWYYFYFVWFSGFYYEAFRYESCLVYYSHVVFQFCFASSSPRLGTRELVYMILVRLFVYFVCENLCCFFLLFFSLFLLMLCVCCGLWLWPFLKFSFNFSGRWCCFGTSNWGSTKKIKPQHIRAIYYSERDLTCTFYTTECHPESYYIKHSYHANDYW